MKNNTFTSLLSLIIALVALLTSCSSVYIDPDISSDNSDVAIEGEYFTTGSLYSSGGGTSATGFFYKGCWLYIERQMTIGPRGQNSNGEIHYGEVQIERVVKYNPVTDTVSSPCLDPVCTHSLESGCVMLNPHELDSPHKTFDIMQLVGDWMILRLRYYDEVYVTKNYVTFYNLQTGEAKKFFEEDLENNVMTRWVSGSSFGNKFYNIKQTLDYSATGFDKTNKDKSIADYNPKTIQTLCEYDLDAGKVTELFELEENLKLFAVSNKRFFFVDDTETFYSSNRDGSNMTKEEGLDFLPDDMVGSYAYSFYELDGFTVYDISKNQKRSVSVEYDEYYECYLADDGVLFDYVVGYEEYLELKSQRSQLRAEYESQGMSFDEINDLINKKLEDALHSQPTKVYKCDFDGENMRLIYEEDNAVIASVYATEEHLFAIRSKRVNGETVSEECIINLKTGEIKTPPLLEVIVPSWYVND